MPGATARHTEFIDILADALEAQDEASRAMAAVALWRPTSAEMAGVRHLSMNQVQQTAAGQVAASRQEMAASGRSQEAVHFYYGRGVVIEQMWLA